MDKLSDCTTSVETLQYVADKVSSVPLQEVKDYMKSYFYNVDDVVEFLYVTLTSKGNGILHGPGGFGKSQITKKFLDYFEITPIVKVGNSGVDVESLLGIPDIQKLTKESKYEVSFENSIFNSPGVLILEEFLDVKPMVAAALKDVLTEGGYRQGNRFIPSKIGSVIICSNKTPDEVSVDLSTAAFYKERFPYSMYSCWTNFSTSDYMNFFNTVFDDVEENKQNYKLLSQLCSASCTEENIVSPRIAIKARDALISTKSIESLKFIGALDFEKIKSIKYDLKVEQMYADMNDDITELTRNLDSYTPKSSTDAARVMYIIEEIMGNLSSVNIVGDALLNSISKLRDVVNEKKRQLHLYIVTFGKDTTNRLDGIDEYFKSIKSKLDK